MKRGPASASELVTDAEQEQDDDQAERDTQEPQQDQDHLVTPPLDACGPVARDRPRRHPARLVMREVHRLARAHPSADDATRQSEQERDRGGHGSGRGRFRGARIDRLSGRCRRRERWAERGVPAVVDAAAEGRAPTRAVTQPPITKARNDAKTAYATAARPMPLKSLIRASDPAL